MVCSHKTLTNHQISFFDYDDTYTDEDDYAEDDDEYDNYNLISFILIAIPMMTVVMTMMATMLMTLIIVK